MSGILERIKGHNKGCAPVRSGAAYLMFLSLFNAVPDGAANPLSLLSGAGKLRHLLTGAQQKQ
ncbi:hypothetical protein [Aeromonas veronii]|uniref:hypothetical protein n=1 Tax=Aeromonas veronii TaxID=654 RepID=UPI003D246E9F